MMSSEHRRSGRRTRNWLSTTFKTRFEKSLRHGCESARGPDADRHVNLLNCKATGGQSSTPFHMLGATDCCG